MSKHVARNFGAGLIALAGGVAVTVKLVGGGPEGASAAARRDSPKAHRGVGGTGSFGRPSSPDVAPATPTPDAGPSTLPATLPTTAPTDAGAAPTTAPATRQSATPSPAAAAPQGLLDRDRLTGDWRGLRPKLEDKGISLNSTLEGNVGRTLSGGLNTADGAGSYLFNLTLSLDTGKLGLWAGGTFYADLRAEDGKRNSLDGAFQATSRAYQPRRDQVSELWYEQKLLDGKLRFKAGKIDANTDFAHADNGAEFVNSGMSYSPTIQDFPTDPDPATGLVAFVYPTDHLYFGYGVFDGALHDGIATGSRGPATLFGSPSDQFMIGEAGVTWATPGHLGGRLGLGGWGQTGTFQRAGGGTKAGTAGAYLTGDQTLWLAHPDQDDAKEGLAAFLLMGEADPAVSPVRYHAGGGLAWTGPIPARDADVAGLGATWVRFGDEPAATLAHGNEWVLEGFYKVQVTPWLSCKPDLQFVHHPGGAAGVSDAVAGSVQFLAAF